MKLLQKDIKQGVVLNLYNNGEIHVTDISGYRLSDTLVIVCEDISSLDNITVCQPVDPEFGVRKDAVIDIDGARLSCHIYEKTGDITVQGIGFLAYKFIPNCRNLRL